MRRYESMGIDSKRVTWLVYFANRVIASVKLRL
jgi:hypothetical protein